MKFTQAYTVFLVCSVNAVGHPLLRVNAEFDSSFAWIGYNLYTSRPVPTPPPPPPTTEKIESYILNWRMMMDEANK